MTQLAFVTTFSIIGNMGEYLRPADLTYQYEPETLLRAYRPRLYVSPVHLLIL